WVWSPPFLTSTFSAPYRRSMPALPSGRCPTGGQEYRHRAGIGTGVLFRHLRGGNRHVGGPPTSARSYRPCGSSRGSGGLRLVVSVSVASHECAQATGPGSVVERALCAFAADAVLQLRPCVADTRCP